MDREKGDEVRRRKEGGRWREKEREQVCMGGYA